ncbi:unnamed protein product [Closterium sp. Yama58-4]|nr:unnamed protein product [Closterium sp. Yama58-4]
MARLTGVSWADGASHGRTARLTGGRRVLRASHGRTARLTGVWSVESPCEQDFSKKTDSHEETAGLCERGWGRGAAEREGSPSPTSPPPLPLHCPFCTAPTIFTDFRHCTDSLLRLFTTVEQQEWEPWRSASVARRESEFNFKLHPARGVEAAGAHGAASNDSCTCAAHGVEAGAEADGDGCNDSSTCAAHGVEAGGDIAGCNDSSYVVRRPFRADHGVVTGGDVAGGNRRLQRLIRARGQRREPTARAGTTTLTGTIRRRGRRQRHWRGGHDGSGGDDSSGRDDDSGGDDGAGGDNGAGGEEGAWSEEV